jgi:hypothetical protein
MKYGMADDDLLIAELPDFTDDFRLLQGCTPPTDGAMLFCLSGAPFDLFEVYWTRASQASLKSPEDRFRRDAAGFARDAKVSLCQDHDGSYTLVLHPEGGDPAALEKQVVAAGQKAGMTITFAPGLFG